MLMETFDFQGLIETIENYIHYTSGKKIPNVENALRTGRMLLSKAEAQQEIAVKFQPQLESLLKEYNEAKLKERVTKAIEYFTRSIADEILQPVEIHIDSLKGVKKIKKYLTYVRSLKLAVARKIQSIQNARLGDLLLNTSDDRISLEEDKAELKKKKAKAIKGDSAKEKLILWKAGEKAADIARKRGLALSTIETHLAEMIKTGEVDVYALVNQYKYEAISAALREFQTSSLMPVKAKLGESFSFGEIRAVKCHMEFLENQ
jgi:uncharacterized protein YpbB